MTTLPMVPSPKLTPIDLSLADGCNHPQIKCGVTYLATVDGQWDLGTFSRQWYGLNFSGFYPAGIQFDRLEAVFEFKDGFQEFLFEMVEEDDDGEILRGQFRRRFPNKNAAEEFAVRNSYVLLREVLE